MSCACTAILIVRTVLLDGLCLAAKALILSLSEVDSARSNLYRSTKMRIADVYISRMPIYALLPMLTPRYYRLGEIIDIKAAELNGKFEAAGYHHWSNVSRQIAENSLLQRHQGYRFPGWQCSEIQ